MIQKLLSYLGYEKKRSHLRSWDSAKTTRLMDGWVSGYQPINQEIRNALGVLRARSRDQAQNNDYMRRFLQLVETNVVGQQGIVLQAKATDPDGTIDDLANESLEAAWLDWGRYGLCDVTGRHSWRSFQRQFIRSVATDGEAFVYLHEDSALNKYGFALQIFDPNRVDHQFNNPDERIEMGVETDQYGRATAFYILEAGMSDYSFQGKRYTRVPADRILHCFLPEWIEGMRGVPWVSQSLLRLGMLGGYEEAELAGARVGASKMGFFYSEDGGEYKGDALDSHGNIIMDAEPGAFEQLPFGVKFQSYDPQHPTTAYGDFVKGVLRGISSGLGVSYNSLANDLEGVNYSSLRQGAIEERAIWMLLQDWMAESFNNRIYRAWLSTSLRNGAIEVMGRPLRPERFDKFANVTWQGRRWQWVDPQKEMAANREAIDLGLRSRSDIIREQGRDPEDVWLEIATERERMDALGILNEPPQGGFLMDEEDADRKTTLPGN